MRVFVFEFVCEKRRWKRREWRGGTWLAKFADQIDDHGVWNFIERERQRKRESGCCVVLEILDPPLALTFFPHFLSLSFLLAYCGGEFFVNLWDLHSTIYNGWLLFCFVFFCFVLGRDLLWLWFGFPFSHFFSLSLFFSEFSQLVTFSWMSWDVLIFLFSLFLSFHRPYYKLFNWISFVYCFLCSCL